MIFCIEMSIRAIKVVMYMFPYTWKTGDIITHFLSLIKKVTCAFEFFFMLKEETKTTKHARHCFTNSLPSSDSMSSMERHLPKQRLL